MKLIDILRTYLPELDPRKCKIHLAIWDGAENPLELYFQNNFDEWQTWQSRKNFQRDFVISLINLNRRNKWLFVGVFRSLSSQWYEERSLHQYELVRLPEAEEIIGRAIVDFPRPGRQSFLYAERWMDDIEFEELLPQRMTFGGFPGFSEIIISKAELDIIVNNSIESWRSALSSVSGIYLITDSATGRHYVGSASGSEGIWGRWCEYSINGHGGNNGLFELLQDNGINYSSNFQYSVLEVHDPISDIEIIRKREQRWKRVLLSIEFGLNEN
jgi:hypothetical protein